MPGRKPLGARTRTNNKLNPHMTPGSGIESRARLMGGEFYDHFGIPAPTQKAVGTFIVLYVTGHPLTTLHLMP